MKILCYDCFSGISGDMNLAALIDLGVPVDYLRQELNKLPLGSYQLKVSREKRKGIEGTMVDVVLPIHAGASVLKNQQHHENRSWQGIRNLILSSPLSEPVKERSIEIFSLLARAEAKIHGTTEEDVHFHEVGAVDSIVDIVGAAICLDYLKPDKIISTPPQLGGGFVKCQHGLIPVPAPATQEILNGKPVKSGIVEFETTTPTGAAILASQVNEFVRTIDLLLGKTGYGIGHRELEIPNILRVYWAETHAGSTNHRHFILECNIDDMNPEWYDYLLEKLFAAGADDAFLQPVIMKKSRPGIVLSVLCDEKNEKQISAILLEETSSLGLRRYEVDKECLERENIQVTIPWGTIRVKLARQGDKVLRWKAEYEDCKRISLENNISLREVYLAVEKILLKEGRA
ncbi:MAG: nickel pincer cofactor biosynthesis protein LarC [Bacteroidales bacterium]